MLDRRIPAKQWVEHFLSGWTMRLIAYVYNVKLATVEDAIRRYWIGRERRRR